MEYTPEQQTDFQKRAQEFQTEHESMLEDLKKKHQVEPIYVPVFVPSPSGIFGVAINQNVGDLKYKAVLSPLNDSLIEG